ncbi:BTAD domain-containing putative transcriptional regulator [Actinomadura rubrisoli]|uniref:Helix-turn-helix domain-containing protein n=1 Tax=Actinomadura rubrisoli TaxID=2530368 RepID=A0A4R5BJF7_9ACTN|nr:BTAD domain-containing putative transcriptional regulator [Actinomadura rubrisoli]TDD85935.1 helix-turn-helix domain-containing protein [Actinomadura rubrisoli]
MPGIGPPPALEIVILGPVAVRRGDGGAVGIGRPLERAVLARLALARGRPVPDERLAADLWGDGDLARPAGRLRVLVSRLRTALDSAVGKGGFTLARTPGGYALDARPADLEAARSAADRAHAAARTGDHAAVRAAAAEALGLWRGPSLADVRGVPFGASEGERLDAWRLDLLVERLAADLETGSSAQVRDELGRLCAEHPLNERLACLLALALYRDGRQADALARLAGLRRALADVLGVDPAPQTVEMEMRLLRQDPSLSPVAAEPVRLPRPVTSFVGRDADRASLLERLARPSLVTVVGEPGSGKSRLAVEVAREVAAAGRAVTLVELAPLRGEDAAVAALAAAAGVEGAAADPVAACAAALDGGLLVLDNAEHLVDQVAEAAGRLLDGARRLTVLVTSQRPLLIAGEEPYRLGPLDPSAAARLFEDRRVADAPSDPSVVGAICAAVDHLPLGVELAAGLTRTLTVRQLAERVDDRLRLLVGGRRDAGGRHASLRAALDWSHDLLPARERVLLRRVAVFSGGFSLEAAERVAAAPDLEPALDVRDVAPAITELADRSLITVEGRSGGRRFGLLETVRDHASAKLDEAGETGAVRAGHLAWCLAHVRAAGQEDDFASAEAVAQVFQEWPNLRDALEHAPGTGRAAEGLRLALELNTPWLVRGWYAEARRHLAALAGAPGAEPAERAAALSDHGFACAMVGRLEEAAELLERAAGLAARIDDDGLAMTVLYHRGIVEIERGRLREAFAPLLAGEELARKAAHEQRMAAFADALGTLQLYAGRPEEAYERYGAGLAADRALGDEHGLARGLSNQAQALLDLGRVEAAVERATESDRYARRLDDRHILPLNELIRGNAARIRGDLAAAESSLRAALAHAEESSDGPGMAHIDLADVLVRRGALDEAAGLLKAVYAQTTEHSTPWLAARTVSAALFLARGEHEAAREVAETAAAAHEAGGFGWRRYVERLRTVTDALAAEPS